MSARLARTARDRTGHRSAPAESHFNPTLSHFVPLSVPLRGPNPAESRPIPPNPAPHTLAARVPGYPTCGTIRPNSKGDNIE